MSQYDSSKAMRNKKEGSLSELVNASISKATDYYRKVASYFLRMPNPLDPFQEFPPIIHDCIDAMARQLRVVTVDHRSAVW